MAIENPQELMMEIKQIFNKVVSDIIVEDPTSPGHYLIDPSRDSTAMEDLASMMAADSTVAVFAIPLMASLAAVWLASLCEATGLGPDEYTYALGLDLLTRK